MDLKVLAVGGRMPAWVADGWNEYARRMPPHLPLELIEVSRRSRASGHFDADQAMLRRVPAGARIVALEVGGRPLSTEALAERLADWQTDGAAVAFLIGDADGLGDESRRVSTMQWSLGPLTLPHMLVRILIAEQLYRAHTILSGHPYHRA